MEYKESKRIKRNIKRKEEDKKGIELFVFRSW